MSELLDLLLKTTDPVVSLLLIVLAGYIREVKATIQDDLRSVRSRIGRLENVYIPDGGEILNEE